MAEGVANSVDTQPPESETSVHEAQSVQPDSDGERQPTTPQANVRPSFNCAFAKTPTEEQICRDSDLALLEQAMVSAYKQCLAQLPADQASTFRREHLIWFKEYTRTCDAILMDGPRKDCIAGYLSSYTRQIEGYTGR